MSTNNNIVSQRHVHGHEQNDSRSVQNLIVKLCKSIIKPSVLRELNKQQEEKLLNRLKHKCFEILLGMQEEVDNNENQLLLDEREDAIDSQVNEDKQKRIIELRLSQFLYRLNCQKRESDANRLCELVDRWRRCNWMFDDPMCPITRESNGLSTHRLIFHNQLLTLVFGLADIEGNNMGHQSMFFHQLTNENTNQSVDVNEPIAIEDENGNQFTREYRDVTKYLSAGENRFIHGIFSLEQPTEQNEEIIPTERGPSNVFIRTLPEENSILDSAATRNENDVSRSFLEALNKSENSRKRRDDIYFFDNNPDKLYLCRKHFDLEEEHAILVDDQTLIHYVLLALQGIPSSYFTYNEEDAIFKPSFVYTKACTAQSTARILTEFAHAGSLVRRIGIFQQLNELRTIQCGVICRAFSVAVGHFMNWFHSAILNTKCTMESEILVQSCYSIDSSKANSNSLTLISLLVHLESIINRLKFVARLCCCDIQIQNKKDKFVISDDWTFEPISERIRTFPKGAKLLTYLYQQSIEVEFYQELKSIAFYLFKSACDPYLKWIREWIYFGTLSDRYNEFYIQPDSIQGKEVDAWRQSYSAIHDNIPIFLMNDSSSIFQIGRTLCVIRQYEPSHFIFTYYPEITGELISIKYSDEMLNYTRNLLIELSMKHNEEHERYLNSLIHQEELAVQRRMAERRVYRKKLEELSLMHNERVLQIVKERLDFKRSLLQQRLIELSEKKAREKRESEKQKSFNSSILNNLDEEEENLKKEAENEIRSEYQAKMKQVEKRIALSRWKFRRSVLNQKRNEFLAKSYEETEYLPTSKRSEINVELSDVEMETESPNIENLEKTVPDVLTSQKQNDYKSVIAPIDNSTRTLDEPMEDIAPTDETLPSVNSPRQQEYQESTAMEIDSVAYSDPHHEQTIDIAEKDNQSTILSNPEQISSPAESNATHGFLEEQDTLSFELSVRESIHSPIKAHSVIVHSITRTMLFNVLKIQDHFKTVRRYILFEAGDFVDVLCSLIFDKIDQGALTHISINTLVDDVVKKAEYTEKVWKHVDKLSLSIEQPNGMFMDPYLIQSLDMIRIDYELEFPLNIIFGSETMSLYNTIYHFLLRLKRIEHVLQNIWTQFKHPTIRRSQDRRILQLQMFRQELQHFMDIMRSYIMTQVISICARDFETKLQTTNSFASVIEAHHQFLQQTIAQCLLGDSTRDTMSIITDIMNLILRFHLQLVSNPLSQPLSSFAFEAMIRTKDEFQHQAMRLYASLKTSQSLLTSHHNPITNRGKMTSDRDPLTLLLNFNTFYEVENDT